MSKTMKTFIGVDLDYSNHEFVSWPFHHHLLSEEITIGANVTNTPAARSAFTNPVGSPGTVLDLVYVYPSFFTSESIMDGAIEGQVIARLYSAWVSSSYTMYLTTIYLTLFKYKADGTMEDIIPESSVWSGSVSLTGDSTAKTRDIPVFFSFDVEDKMTTDAILALRVRMLGYLNSAASNMYYQVLCSPTDGDLKITIPFVEEE